jgi:beta-glucosidase
MKKNLIIVAILFYSIANAQQTSVKNIDRKVDSVLKLMTLKEKVGQLNQLPSDAETGTQVNEIKDKSIRIKNGEVGSILNMIVFDDKIPLQEAAMQSRLKIPLLFGLDVIHGHRTIFPIPLAQSASWDITAIEKAERIAAVEAAADGINWTFAPMVDITHDPRWGRIMEGSGEDPFLGSIIAAARVRGFQGKDLSDRNTIVACAKHFAGYGFAEAGRDYNTVDMSEQRLRNDVLPPFKACVDAGIGTFMNSFNVLNGTPASMNSHLQREILKGEWGFKGFVVSDWNSYGEILNHGAASDRKDVAQKVMTAGSDMDMCSGIYSEQLEALVKEGKINIKLLDESVKRILRIKFMLGLFDDPFRYLKKENNLNSAYKPEYLAHARTLAAKSMVLLKNDANVLPLSRNTIKKIAIIGPFANAKKDKDYLSFWTLGRNQKKVITLADGIKNKIGNAAECMVMQVADSTTTDIAAAVENAKQADVIIAAVGEHGLYNGEGRSFANLALPEEQLLLLKELKKLGKPIVVVLFTGRTIIDKWLFENMPVVLNAWQPGMETGNAVADVLFGDYNPSGKLTVSWPKSMGQIPLYYNYLNTGRPKKADTDFWVSRYSDESNEPQFPFGYGLSYSKFVYSNFKLSSTVMKRNGKLMASIDVKNESNVDGEEIVQLYIRDMVADISRPIKELKAFEKVLIKAGEIKTITFTITEKDLKYWNQNVKYKADEGDFKIMIGSNAKELEEKDFRMKNGVL